jgi:hypothetical protein
MRLASARSTGFRQTHRRIWDWGHVSLPLPPLLPCLAGTHPVPQTQTCCTSHRQGRFWALQYSCPEADMRPCSRITCRFWWALETRDWTQAWSGAFALAVPNTGRNLGSARGYRHLYCRLTVWLPALVIDKLTSQPEQTLARL